MKRLSSASTFDLRVPYGAENVQLKRISVLAGTCNEIEVLNDPSGNRRFIVLEVNERMDWEGFNQIDKDQLFAELKHEWDSGETGNLLSHEIDMLEEHTPKYSEVSQEEELIAKYYYAPKQDGFDAYTNTEIKVYLENQARPAKLSARKLGLELKKLGYIQKSVVTNGVPLKKYIITKIPFNND